ncbi:formylglycine-generating enzyme family protein [Aurantiacibacter sp. MUD61]|uniref:formylglycine-generating enzyme family protein n=1 Tax=Aurantiacibacter sp. MUD61 TaxID=3009083 RepID=UPI0022F12631|nr:formylglycine-generating enzyme family protein [Aurantiacibacter sp. MUD61]
MTNPVSARLTLPLLAAVSLAACSQSADEPSDAPGFEAASDFASTAECAAIGDLPIRIAGGTFIMGQDDIYAEEGPRRETRVDGFWIDPHEVTNRQFAAFVEATGYETVAEKPVDPALFGVPEDQIPPELLLPGSAVFTPPDQPSTRYTDWWKYVPGANWMKPYGPDGPDAQENQPVVHLAWDDMVAYANWAGGRLPTEAEWEYAASAGADPYSAQPDGETANSWQGAFPVVNEETDGFAGIAPVGCFAPNANGLYDMVGNAWEVTQDFYRPGHDPDDNDNPTGPSENAAYDPYNPGLASRVMKGGSYLCAPNYCQRYRPASRQGRDPGLGTSNVGFRLAYDERPDA